LQKVGEVSFAAQTAAVVEKSKMRDEVLTQQLLK
jgi:hypothetical protein